MWDYMNILTKHQSKTWSAFLFILLLEVYLCIMLGDILLKNSWRAYGLKLNSLWITIVLLAGFHFSNDLQLFIHVLVNWGWGGGGGGGGGVCGVASPDTMTKYNLGMCMLYSCTTKVYIHHGLLKGETKIKKSSSVFTQRSWEID